MFSMKEMLDIYEKFNGASSYIIGFAYNKKVYALATEHLPMECLTLEQGSSHNGGGVSVRFRPRVPNKIKMLDNAFEVGTVSEMTNNGYNKGENFERLVAKHYGQDWKKDNLPWWKGGDMELNGKAIQLKYESATVITESAYKKFAGC